MGNGPSVTELIHTTRVAICQFKQQSAQAQHEETRARRSADEKRAAGDMVAARIFGRTALDKNRVVAQCNRITEQLTMALAELEMRQVTGDLGELLGHHMNALRHMRSLTDGKVDLGSVVAWESATPLDENAVDAFMGWAIDPDDIEARWRRLQE